MAAMRIYSDWNTRSSDNSEQIEPYRKYLFICEGENTEVWYFRHLIEIRKELGINPLIDIQLLERTEEDKTNSNPKKLIEYANAIIRTPSKFNFDVNRDKIVLVFDADIYQEKLESYRRILNDAKEFILAISNPCFELFLLLHVKDSYLNHIKGNKTEIERNQKISKSKRFIGNLFFEVTGMNSKKNKLIGLLASDVKIAIDQEARFINQDLIKGFQELTSTTGLVIQQIMDDDSKE